jgi:hypothetical protein
MFAKDLKPNRMLKRVAADFADERPNRIGTVVCSEAYTKPGYDKAVVLEAIKSKYDNGFTGWTGIGMGLATAEPFERQ